MVDDVPGQRSPPASSTVSGPAVPAAAGTGIVGLGGPAGARVAPDRVALVVDGGGTLTYGEWDSRSNRVARGLAARGVAAGDRVGLLFDGRHWVDFVVARSGVVKAGAAPVLLSPGAASADLNRAVAHAGAVGLLCAAHRAPPPVPSAWVAGPDTVAAGHDAGPLTPGSGPGECAELVYPPAPMAPPVPLALGADPSAAGGLPCVDGWFVHAWAPGTVAGRYPLALMRAPSHLGVLALGAFDPDRLCAAVAARRATGCGLTPALAAALLASGAAVAHDVSSVAEVVLSGPASPEVITGLRAAFPGAALRVLDGGRAQPAVTVGAHAAPVAVSQEGMLWHEQFTPGSFNLPCLVRRYQGRLDVAALERALSELVRGHEPLRSTFAVVDGRARQVVHPHRPVLLASTDLGGLPAPAPGERVTPRVLCRTGCHQFEGPPRTAEGAEDRDAAAGRLLAAASRRPFDLATGPLFDPHLVRLGPDDHLLVVRLHHTVFDDWSVDLFRRELSALYAAATAGQPSPLLPPAATFAELAEVEQAALAGDAGAAQRSWWRRELDGAPLATQLPLDGDGDGDDGDDDRSDAGEPLRVDLPPSLVDALRGLAPRLRATPFMTVLAGFSALASGLTGQDDLVIATVVAHRNLSAAEPLIGCFTKKVPLRLGTGGDPTFAELVGRTRASLLGSLAHQDLGFEAAVQAGLGHAAAEHGVVPHLAVVFQGETPRQARLALPGLTTSR